MNVFSVCVYCLSHCHINLFNSAKKIASEAEKCPFPFSCAFSPVRFLLCYFFCAIYPEAEFTTDKELHKTPAKHDSFLTAHTKSVLGCFRIIVSGL